MPLEHDPLVSGGQAFLGPFLELLGPTLSDPHLAPLNGSALVVGLVETPTTPLDVAAEVWFSWKKAIFETKGIGE
eukprot:4516398-Amphidinium_carterae.1